MSIECELSEFIDLTQISLLISSVGLLTFATFKQLKLKTENKLCKTDTFGKKPEGQYREFMK